MPAKSLQHNSINWLSTDQELIEQGSVSVWKEKFSEAFIISRKDGVLPDQGGEFDILAWWKYWRRNLTPHRSRLRPDTVETLMRLQNWLRGDMKGSSNSKPDIIGCSIILEDFDDPTSQGILLLKGMMSFIEDDQTSAMTIFS
ncbi:hypothetical protein Lal_00029891 [Lupinus albus]|nr:hypothetical protein Lal_00029891 [Lupinus albus]